MKSTLILFALLLAAFLPSVQATQADIRPVTVRIYDYSPICIVLVAVEFEQPSLRVMPPSLVLEDNETRRQTSAGSVHPVGPDWLTRQFIYAFHPENACATREITWGDFRLAIIP